MKKIALFMLVGSSLFSSLAWAGQPKQLNAQRKKNGNGFAIAQRCNDDQIDGATAKARLDWMLKNGYITKGTYIVFTTKKDDDGNDVPFLPDHINYPLLLIDADINGDLNDTDAIWKPDVSKPDLPDNVYWGATCEAGCYTPSQRVYFEKSYISIKQAYDKDVKNILTTAKDSTLDSLKYFLQPIAH